MNEPHCGQDLMEKVAIPIARCDVLEDIGKGKLLPCVIESSDHFPEDVGISRRLDICPASDVQCTRTRVNECHPAIAHRPFAITKGECRALFHQIRSVKAPGILFLVTRTPLMVTLRSNLVFATFYIITVSDVLARLLSCSLLSIIWNADS